MSDSATLQADAKPTLDAALSETFPASDPIAPGPAAQAEPPPRGAGPQAQPATTAPITTPFRFPRSVPSHPTSLRELTHYGPGITTMIRLDHAHVLATARRFRTTSSVARKRAIVDTVCDALEIQAQLEDEIFYPALQIVLGEEHATLAEVEPQHQKMNVAIWELRSMKPEDDGYDDLFLHLMRMAMHHIADVESVLLPAAERLLVGRLGQMGWMRTRRRAQLVGPRFGDIAADAARVVPTPSWVAMVSLIAGGFLLGRSVRGR